MQIKRRDSKIFIIFHDEDISKALLERFNIFIKNITSDVRSKIEDLNVKYRLVNFFREADEMLLSENHQYTFDEYFEMFKNEGIYKGMNLFLSKINYISDMDKDYIYLLKNKNTDNHCMTCEYFLSSNIIETIIHENDEYRNLGYEVAESKIGFCEIFEAIDLPKKLDYWCPSYLKREEQELVKKLIK